VRDVALVWLVGVILRWLQLLGKSFVESKPEFSGSVAHSCVLVFLWPAYFLRWFVHFLREGGQHFLKDMRGP